MDRRIHDVKRVRNVALTAAWVVFAVTAPATAQTDPGPSADRREILVGGGAQPAAPLERCVEVEIGRERAYGCLNYQLRREVDRVNPSLNLPPIDARSPDIRVGNVNEAALRQQYGSNFGRSAFPYRPPAPALVLPRR